MGARMWKNGMFVEIDSPQELVDRLQRNLAYYQEIAENANDRAKKTREEVAAEIKNEHDKENEYLKDKLRFTIARVYSEKELEAYRAFEEAHMACRMTKATGGACPIIRQHGTGIGVVTELTCPVCKQTKDITDTDAW